MEMRANFKDTFLKKHNIKLGFMSAFVKASAYALQDQPVVNAGLAASPFIFSSLRLTTNFFWSLSLSGQF